jgi:SPX domain protein involved in polyphosphate accumulation
MAKEVKESISGKYELENFILKLIEKRKKEFELLKRTKDDYIELDYVVLFNRLNASINDLYLCLTAYDNNYEKINK